MLIEFMQRSFAIKSQEQFVREQYATGKGLEVDYQAYAYIMLSTKEQIEKSASLLTANLRAARSLFPTSMHEYEIRRDYLNAGILNAYGRYSKAIDREIELIKRWRQRDNKMKSYLPG